MHLPVLIFGIILLPKDSRRDAVKVCPSPSHLCGAMRIVSYGGGSKLDDARIKSCFLSHECVEGSVNFGISRIAIPIKCCDSHLCNTQDAPEPSKSAPNGKKCYHCSGPKCTLTLNCQGKEDYCFSNSAGKKLLTKGCATNQICSKHIDATIKATIKGDIRCCQGDYCNSAISTSASLLLLGATLISLVMFS